MRKRRSLSLVVVSLVAAVLLAWTFIAGNSPLLGLDLQGGASVVLQPPGGTPRGTVNQAIEIIRNRVDALGVAEPEISRQGDAIVVELPGIDDQQQAIEVVGTTAELRFRPVLNVLPPDGETTTTTTSTTSTTSTTVAEGEEGAETTTSTTSTTAPTTTTTVPEGTTPRDENEADAEVVLPGEDPEEGRYVLGPAGAVGSAVKTARATVTQVGAWYVELELTGQGSDDFDELAGRCFNAEPTCPTGQLAIELDGVVQSAPQVQQASFGGELVIEGDFSEGEARDLALVLRYGSLPVQLEQQTVRTVSATLGEDSLRAGLIAGAVGAVALLAYIFLYYRILGVVVVAGFAIWAALQWSVLSWLGETQGLALTLSGITGIVIAIGVTVDSDIVYFERLKDELHLGRPMRSAVDSAFKASIRTIFVANSTAFLGAAVLYWLTVGPVRGFAFTLGLATLLDLIIAYWFRRPLVALLAKRGLLQRSKFIGMATPVPETIRPGLGRTS